jgi:hypothetical protein
MPKSRDEEPSQWVLGPWARRDLRDAHDEVVWRLSQYRIHKWGCCETDVEEDLRAELTEAQRQFADIVWACHKGRRAGVWEIADVCGVGVRTIERALALFKEGMSDAG